ncbi:hypothetical protein [Bacillus marinisedimentorum]|uniref:hypothetical protein n=1 Tax=Bacillus marinisedimentorum TaxID=1821260 RepID=UPI000872FC27|nr:hypothetical protein [Bacillus marinisedimentorum]
MTGNISEKYRRILAAYRLTPQKVTGRGRIKKVETDGGTFALKKTRLRKEDAGRFAHMLQTIYKKGYRRLLAPSPTISGQPGVEVNGVYYTLTPWIDTNEAADRNIKKYPVEIARLHRMTVKEQELSAVQLDAFSSTVRNIRQKQRYAFETFMETCEQRVYMSPGEYLFTSSFFQVMVLLEDSERWLAGWREEAGDKKARICAVLHNACEDHFLTDREGGSLLINLEQAGYDSPVFDLLFYTEKHAIEGSADPGTFVESLEPYFEAFSWRMEEKYLFAALLVSHQELLDLCLSRLRLTDHLTWTRRLQQAVWKLEKRGVIARRMIEMETE